MEIESNPTSCGRGPSVLLALGIGILVFACGSSTKEGSATTDDGSSSNTASSDGTTSSNATSSGGGGGSSSSSSSSGSDGSGAANSSSTGSGGNDTSSGTTKTTSTDTGSGGATTVPPFQEQWRSCDTADDCVFLNHETCCGCVLVGVNQEFEGEAHESLVDANLSECGDVGCATQGCAPDPVAACEDGVCVERPGCSMRTLDDCEGDGMCRIYSARNCQNPDDEIVPMVCGTPPESETCSEDGATCRVSAFGLMLLFEDGCTPSAGCAQTCPIECE